MILTHGVHLAYCTNVHPGEDWAQTLDSLNRWTLAVKEQVAPTRPFAIGLRLSDQASRELAEPSRLHAFKEWLETHQAYVFTINGFPFGRFHGGPVKEQVYRPDWTDSRRLDYTCRLFNLLAALAPRAVECSVSTLPGSFKEFIRTPEQERLIRDNVFRCVEHIAALAERTGRKMHLGLEPEPLGLFENSAETVKFFEQLREEHPGDTRLEEYLGVNYDTCHFAVEFEEPKDAVAKLRRHGIRLSKIHISNALRLRPTTAAREQLRAFAEDVYLHQVIARSADGKLTRFRDLGPALAGPVEETTAATREWRVHFHIPLHSRPPGAFNTTADHVLGLFEILAAEPQLCRHLEMETYTWQVLPEGLKSRDVAQQIVGEYRWTLEHLAKNGFVPNRAGEARLTSKAAVDAND
jgi:sugar phosphate isomerase/epimerase